MTKSITIIVSAAGAIIGAVQNLKKYDLGANIAIKSADDMMPLSLDQMTAIYNNATGKAVGKFKIGKDKAIEKVMAALQAMDVEKMVKLDAAQQAKVETKAKEIAAKPGERKVRDSKLQRMKRAFETKEGETYKQWSIKELMEACDTTEKITHQYISILRAPSDRFVMNIIKDKEAKTFQFQPKEKKARHPAPAVSQAAA